MITEKKINKFITSIKEFPISSGNVGYKTKDVDDWCENASMLIKRLVKEKKSVDKEKSLLEREVSKFMNSKGNPEKNNQITERRRKLRNSDHHHIVKRVSELEREVSDLKRKMDRIRKK